MLTVNTNCQGRTPACEGHLATLGQRFIEQGFYQSALGVLEELAQASPNESRKYIARALTKAMDAYTHWFLMQHEKAHRLLGEAIELAEGRDDLTRAADLWHKQAKYLRSIVEQLSDNERAYMETYHSMVDLYYNSVFQAFTGDYVTCLTRFWRLYEGLLQYHYRTAHGVEPILTSPRPGSSEENELKLREYLARLGRARGRGTLYVHELREILRSVYGDGTFDSLGKTIVHIDKGTSLQPLEMDKALTQIREARNDSCAAHGMRPVPRRVANTCLIAGRALLDGYFYDNTHEIADYPFAPEKIAALAALLDSEE